MGQSINKIMDCNDINFNKEKFVCPFSNLLDFALCYSKIAEDADLQIIRFFLGCSYRGEEKKVSRRYSSGDMEMFILDFVRNKDRSCFPPKWMEFNYGELNGLLTHNSFFEEYNACRKDDSNEVSFANLELYIFAKLQSISCGFVSENKTFSVWNSWCKNDLLQSIYCSGYFRLIHNVYKCQGKDWFCHYRYGETTFDPVFYKYGFYAISSAYFCNGYSTSILRDLRMLRSEFKIATIATATDNDESNIKFLSDIDKFVDDVQKEHRDVDDDNTTKRNSDGSEELTHAISSSLKGSIMGAFFGPVGMFLGAVAGAIFGSPQLRKWAASIANDFVHSNPQPVYDKETEEKTKKALDSAIAEIERDNVKKDDFASEVTNLAIAATGQNGKGSNNFDKSIEKVLPKLSEAARENIGAAFCLFRGGYYSHAANLLAQCVEVEANNNIFIPFRDSVFDGHERLSYSCDKNIKKTEKALMGKESVTLGNLCFIGGLLKGENYGNSEYVQYLAKKTGANVEILCDVCKDISINYIGEGKLSIIEIRNGITHRGGKKISIERNGKELVVCVDRQCFEDVKLRLFEKPKELIVKIEKIGMDIKGEHSEITGENIGKKLKNNRKRREKKKCETTLGCRIGDKWGNELSKIK